MFGPGSQFHRLFNDPRWALGIVRATVLEAAHPQVGAALTDNSTFVAHPWRRLRNTLVSLQRMFGADDHVRQREAARLNRLHERLSGTDAQNRPYDAMDPQVRAWVVATLFESAVTMYRLSGQPLKQSAMEQLYAEFQAFLAALGVADGHLPPTLKEFWQYYDHTVETELENTEALRIILYKLFDHLPAPPLLSGLPTVWAAGRALAGPVIGTVTVASLPEPFRRRAGLPEVPGAQTLMQSAYVAAGLARHLPEGWIETEALTDLLYLSPDSDDPRAATLAALHGRMKRAGALFRLVTPFPVQPEPAAEPAAAPERQRSAEEFFDAVLDQTGDGHLDWPDLAAMARELSTRLDLDEPEETRLYNAYAEWWKELQSALDTDGDGRVSKEEYAAAVPSLAGPALIRVAEVLFDATDKNGDRHIDADEYRTLFRTAFHRTLTGTDETYSRSAFVKDFLSFMSGRRHSTAYDPLLAQA
ncbi:EF-hand domain-containing protein [Streptomyces sp. GMY02]|uniref:EF-hand domain-containing protein n=1 Tax=Streptomyces sp. GMY02 TaxID=1333528 RepID=UPI001C2BD60C|nr:EF-hand domain-containing protein [Streptomyces sp. GMY02]QXE39240.1 EF-hand domain-containing protein [Streptomyces sp. GMY02]